MRLQIHLSTAIVLMFTAGVLIWVNTRERKVVIHTITVTLANEDASEDFPGDPVIGNYGWPFNAAVHVIGRCPYFSNSVQGFSVTNNSNEVVLYSIPGALQFQGTQVAIDVMSAFAILAVIWFALEFRIQRR